MSSARIDKLLEFLKSSPEDPFLHHALALEYIKEGEEAQAEQHFRKNLDSAPDYLATYYHLGKLLERKAEIEAALEIYQQGMTLAKAAGDMHTYSELQSAYEELAW